MNIGEAVHILKEGGRVRRASWPPGDHVKQGGEGMAFRYVEKCGEGQTDRTMTWFTPDIVAEDWERI